MPAEPPTFDLQSHSRHSDGELAPADVVAGAAAAGVELLAVSDHDTVAGVGEAGAAGAELGVRVVPAVEISAIHGGEQDLHILGYLVDPGSAALLSALEAARAERQQRADAMANALKELGYTIDEEMLAQRAAQGKSIGRPHLAQAVVTHPANAPRLDSEGLGELSNFLVAYLIDGRPAFRPRTWPSVDEAIAVIHEAGGVAIWAHPYWDIPEDERVTATIERFCEAGLDGVECFYVTHTRKQVELLTDLCAARGLLMTGSSDFHGPNHKRFARFRAFELFGREPRLGPIATG